MFLLFSFSRNDPGTSLHEDWNNLQINHAEREKEKEDKKDEEELEEEEEEGLMTRW